MSQHESLIHRLKAAFLQSRVEVGHTFGPELILLPETDLVSVCTQLKQGREFRFDILEDYTALNQGTDFMLVLHLSGSRDAGQHLTVKMPVARTIAKAPTLVKIYCSAEWYEREIYDMFGIYFQDHPDLRRILLPDDWTGYPLRKDYKDEKMIGRPGA